MKKKIYIISLFLLFFVFKIDVLAKEIIVNGTSYDDSISFSGDGFLYDSLSKRLSLDNYHGGIISYVGSLEIYISNTNSINAGGSLVGIDCNDLNILGNGSLSIKKGSIGIECDNLIVKDVNIYIERCNVGIMSLNNDFILNNVNIVIKDCNLGIYGSKNISFNQSWINILNCSGGIRREKNGVIALNKTHFYSETNNYGIENIKVSEINNSSLVLKSNNKAISSKNIILEGDNVLYVCNDNMHYIMEEDYDFYPIIKVTNNILIDDLLSNDKKMIIELDDDFYKGIKSRVEFDNDNYQPVLTQNEYTDKEYTDSDYEKIEIVNPSTIDEIYVYVVMFLTGMLLAIIVCYFWRCCE